jgi:L-seryl-tRNA(Ser) seleniumtransferase
LVTFSGDKLLGGPQAGIIAGKPEWVRRIRRNPLFRALRVDKLTYAALEATLRDYLFGRYDRIPVLRMIRADAEEIRRRTERFVSGLRLGESASIAVEAGESVLGGGSTPDQSVPTTLIHIRPAPGQSAGRVEQRLRRGSPAVVARIEDDCLLIDLRTVQPAQESSLADALQSALAMPDAE